MGFISTSEFRISQHPASRGPVAEDSGLQPMPFGEFLVERKVIDRAQLFRALCSQDQSPGIRLGEAVVILGYAPPPEVNRLLDEFMNVPSVEC